MHLGLLKVGANIHDDSKFFSTIYGLKEPVENQARQFVEKARSDPKWFNQSLMNFIIFQKERVKRKEISEGTIGNYYKAIKLFCEMNFDQPLDKLEKDSPWST